MSQTVLIGLITAIGLLIGTMLTLIGVLTKTSADFRLGKRTAGVQETSAETARIAQLVDENEKARTEVNKQWQASLEVKHTCDLADTQHKAEKAAWAAEKEALLATIAEQLRTAAAQSAKLDQVGAEAGVALRAQERAEGGLQQARRTISQFSPSPQFSPAPPGQLPETPTS